jgi:SET domain-containing protein
MAYFEKHIYTRKSTLPGAGKGLFTKAFIPKGTRIVEYKGEILTWKEVGKMEEYRNGYVFYVNSRHVIDAWNHKGSLARYANDARGITRIEGVKSNSEYIVDKKRCFITATTDIPAGTEIFVEYGAEYWQVIRYNIRLEQKKIVKAGKNRSAVELPHHKLAKRLKADKYRR